MQVGCAHFLKQMTLATIHNKIYFVPTSWNELTGAQLVKIMRLLHQEMDITEGRLQLLRVITGMSWWRFVLADPEVLSQFLYLTDFLVEKNTLTKQLLPKYRGYYGPSSNFENLRMGEFVLCEHLYFSHKDSPANPSLVNELVAILYREAKEGYDFRRNPDGDARIVFNEFISQYSAHKKISKWPEEVKRAIVYWYEACREKMISDFPDVFAGGSGEPAKYGLISVMRSVAEKGIHGNFESVEQKYVRLIMVELDEMLREAKQQLESIKQN